MNSSTTTGLCPENLWARIDLSSIRYLVDVALLSDTRLHNHIDGFVAMANWTLAILRRN